jgi:transposase
MMKLVLTRNQRYRLKQQLAHTHEAATYRRTLAILELDQSKTVTHVARTLGVTRQTIYNWLEAYCKTHDPLTLADAARSGRPSTWTPDLQELLQTLLHDAPSQWGYQATQWTVPLLQQQLATWDGRCPSEDTMRRQLHELGYVWKRTRYVLPPDPDEEKKTAHSPAA